MVYFSPFLAGAGGGAMSPQMIALMQQVPQNMGPQISSLPNRPAMGGSSMTIVPQMQQPQQGGGGLSNIASLLAIGKQFGPGGMFGGTAPTAASPYTLPSAGSMVSGASPYTMPSAEGLSGAMPTMGTAGAPADTSTLGGMFSSLPNSPLSQGAIGADSGAGTGGGFFDWLSNLWGGGGGGSGMGGLGAGAGYAAAIGIGKNTEYNHPDTAMGQGLLAGLGPSASQIQADPIGMGLPTALGAPFLTPFTSSTAAQATAPEWQGIFGIGF